MSDKYGGSKNRGAWSKFVLSELERLNLVEHKQDEKIDSLDTRVTKLETKISMQSKFLAGVSTIASGLLIAVVVLIIEYFLK